MRHRIAIAARSYSRQLGLLLTMMLSACGGGPTSQVPGPVFDPIMTVTAPAPAESGSEVEFTISIRYGKEPFTLSCSFGGGTVPETITDLEIDREDKVRISLADVDVETEFPFAFQLSSAYGAKASAGGTFRVKPAAPANLAPVIESATFGPELATLEVVATDAEGDAIALTLSLPPGVEASPVSQTMQSGVAAIFNLSYEAPVPEGGYGSITIHAQDTAGGSDSLEIEIPSTPPPPPSLLPDTLYAIPAVESAVVDGLVRISVRTGALPHAFKYLRGVRVTVDQGADYVLGSFNAGEPGGAADFPDGIWAGIGLSDFVGPPGGIEPTPVDLGDGKTAFDFVLRPVDGVNISDASGEIFSFELRFSAPGTYRLGFQASDGVARTYYGWDEDGGIATTNWGDIANDHPGFANSVVVSEGEAL